MARTVGCHDRRVGRAGLRAAAAVVKMAVRCVVATFSSVTRQHLLQAIAECDERGGETFLEVYSFAPSADYALVHEGRSYDLPAILGVAHRFATGRAATSQEFTGSAQGAVAILRKRGFEVIEPAVAARAVPVRAARAARAASAPRAPVIRAAAAREAPPAICPTCSMTLPATGVCDDCG